MTWLRRRPKVAEGAQPPLPKEEPVLSSPPDAPPPCGGGRAADLFAFLENCTTGGNEGGPALQPAGIASRALELANDDWTEQEAADELVRVVRGDRRALQQAYRRLQWGLIQNPLVDLRCIRASLIVREALQQLTSH